MSSKTLRQLYDEHTGKISDKWSLYLTQYNRLFADFREENVRMLEIGIQNGGSLEIWSKYFPNASVIVGCDINSKCAALSFDDPRIHVVVGDANTSEIRDQVLRISPQFDIIIDDGSHKSSDIVKAFALYFPLLADGGLFIIEDLHCSYWESFEGGLFDPYSAITFFKRLADMIHFVHWGQPKTRAEVLSGLFWKYNCKIDEELLSRIHSIEFINSICVVKKALVEKKRFVANNLETDRDEALTSVRKKYFHLLDNYREKPVCLLNIGIKNDGSFERWSKYFKQASKIIGCGSLPESTHPTEADSRVCLIADDTDVSSVHDLTMHQSSRFDIIIDSRSRTSGDIIKTFAVYFPLLSDGGLYIVEDLPESYCRNFEGAPFDPFSAINFFDRLVDIINHEHWGFPIGPDFIFRSVNMQYGCNIDADLLSHVHSIEFIDSFVAVHKASPDDNRLCRRIIGGTIESVTSGITQAQGSDTYLLDQSLNPWTRLASTEEELAVTKQLLRESERQLDQITSSCLWKSTLPLRETGRRINKLLRKKHLK